MITVPTTHNEDHYILVTTTYFIMWVEVKVLHNKYGHLAATVNSESTISGFVT